MHPILRAVGRFFNHPKVAAVGTFYGFVGGPSAVSIVSFLIGALAGKPALFYVAGVLALMSLVGATLLYLRGPRPFGRVIARKSATST